HGRGGGDHSRSAIAFRKGIVLRREGKTFEGMSAALRADSETADWVREKGDAHGGRELRRIWDHTIPEHHISSEFSDDRLGLEFTARHAHELRYVAKWSSWLHWDGTRWKFEDTLKSFDLARVVARDAANACNNSNHQPKIASAKTVAAIEKLARADRRHATT